MTQLHSQIDTQSEVFKNNHSALQQQTELLHQHLARIVEGGGSHRQKQQRDKGKLLARERINTLLDPDSPFRTLSTGHLMSMKMMSQQRDHYRHWPHS